MFSNLGHTLLNILPKLLKVYIKVSLNWSKPISDHLFNKFSLNPVQFLGWVHGIDSIHFLIESIDLLLAGVEGYLEFN